MALTKVTSAGLTDDSIVNADINSSAAVALSKLATDPSNATNLASGTVPTARLGSGTASSSTVLYGDQTYKAEPGGANTPAFSAIGSAVTSVAHDTVVKIAFNTEVFDTDSTYDTSLYRFTPAVVGKYLMTCLFSWAENEERTSFRAMIYVNGGRVLANLRPVAYYNTVGVSGIVDLTSTSDYVEAMGYQNSGGARNVEAYASLTDYVSYFSGFKIIT